MIIKPIYKAKMHTVLMISTLYLISITMLIISAPKILDYNNLLSEKQLISIELNQCTADLLKQSAIIVENEINLTRNSEAFDFLSETSVINGETMVKIIQCELSHMNYPSPLKHGRIDQGTRNSIRDFQAKNGLPVTGKTTIELLLILRAENNRTGDCKLRPARS